MLLEMECTDNSLYVKIKGQAKKRNIKKLKRKIYFLMEEYSIKNLIIDVSDINKIDGEAFYDFLDAYDDDYNGKLELIEE